MTPDKVILIGSASYAWTRQFIRDLLTTPVLQGSSTKCLQPTSNTRLDFSISDKRRSWLRKLRSRAPDRL